VNTKVHTQKSNIYSVEYEFHMLSICPLYSNLRRVFPTAMM